MTTASSPPTLGKEQQIKQQDLRLGLFLAASSDLRLLNTTHRPLGIYRITDTIDQYTHYIAEETEA